MPIALTVVVSGVPVPISAIKREFYGDIINRALVRSGNLGVQPVDWELRDVSGRLLEPGIRLRDIPPPQNATLFLSPRCGAGGTEEPPCRG